MAKLLANTLLEELAEVIMNKKDWTVDLQGFWKIVSPELEQTLNMVDSMSRRSNWGVTLGVGDNKDCASTTLRVFVWKKM